MGQKRAIRELGADDAWTVSTGELAHATGLSTDTIQRDIKLGELKATRRTPTSHYRIELEEAKRYCRRVCGAPSQLNAANAANAR
jgi:excisionase family DNA binding protein